MPEHFSARPAHEYVAAVLVTEAGDLDLEAAPRGGVEHRPPQPPLDLRAERARRRASLRSLRAYPSQRVALRRLLRAGGRRRDERYRECSEPPPHDSAQRLRQVTRASSAVAAARRACGGAFLFVRGASCSANFGRARRPSACTEALPISCASGLAIGSVSFLAKAARMSADASSHSTPSERAASARTSG